jgi:hypothetical protein
MSDDYPRDDELKRIREWTYEQGYEALADYVQRLWKWPEFGFTLRDWKKDDFDTEYRELRLATGGWSGNEDIIGALYDNMMFRMLCWYSSHRGGLHIFHLIKIKAKDDAENEK